MYVHICNIPIYLLYIYIYALALYIIHNSFDMWDKKNYKYKCIGVYLA
jgi:hypothetical protein